MQQWCAFNTTSVHARLVELAAHPFDLTGEGAIDHNRIERYIVPSSHFSLHYWAQRVNDEILDMLQKLADECDLVSQFKAMKAGTVMNSIAGVESEHRQVLHTACRDFFSGKPRHPGATEQARGELAKLKQFLEDLDSGVLCNDKGERFTTFIHIGIGGSDLGPRSVFEAIKAFGLDGRFVRFVSNVDPDDATAVVEQVDLDKCLVCIVSKSGTTLETLTNEEIVRQRFVASGLDPAKHCIAVTGKGSPMDDPHNYLRTFYMFDSIGGRYSTTSMVGLVMLGFALGYEQIMEFLAGAADIDGEAEEPAVRRNAALLQALLGVWNHSYLGMDTVAVLPYSQALHRFPAHLQQCDMESNGKSVDRQGKAPDYKTGPVVWGEIGTNGQHAFYQLLHQGTERVPCEFIGFRKSQYGNDHMVHDTTSQQKLVANMLAQSLALATGQNSDNANQFFPGNRPSSILLADRLTPRLMGALLAFYEAKVVFQGFTWNINSFDQEGVQLGKVLAMRFLKEMKPAAKRGQSWENKLLQSCAML